MYEEDVLEPAKVRLKLSGLLAFAGNLLGSLAGLAFTILVARRLTPELFGIWGTIMYFSTYPLWISRIPRYWGLRSAARGEPHAASTAAFFSVILGSLLAVVFAGIGAWTSIFLEVDPCPFLLFSIAVFMLSVAGCMESLVRALKTHYYGPSILMYQILRLIVVYFLLCNLFLGLYAPIIATILAGLAEVLFIVYSLRAYLRGKPRIKDILKWLKLGWLPLYHAFPRFLRNFYAFVVVIATSSTLPIAYFRVVSSIGNFLTLGASLGVGLYPKLLRGGGVKDVEEVFKLFFLFVIPITVGCIVAAPHILSLFGSEYIPAVFAFQLSAFSILLSSFNNVVSYILMGLEKVDLEEQSSVVAFLKSRLFKTPSTLVFPALAGLFVIYWLCHYYMGDTIAIVTAWVAIYVFFFAVSVGIRVYMARNIVRRALPWRNIMIYLAASLVMALVVHTASGLLPLTRTFIRSLFNVVVLFTVGGSTYFAITWLLDSFLQNMIHAGLAELQRRMPSIKH